MFAKTSRYLALATIALLGSCSTLGSETATVDASFRQSKYAVLVHKSNSYSADDATMKGFVKSLFLGQTSQWPDGTTAEPYARKDGSTEMQEFQNQVLGMSDAELSRHWIKMKNSKGITPPRALGSGRLAAKYVAKDAGAFVVVATSDVPSSGDVKTLFTF